MSESGLTTLGEIVGRTGGALQTGPFGSQLHASDYTLLGTPLVMPVNLGDNEIRESGIARVGSRDARHLRRHALREGDVVFSRRGDVGRRSIVRAEQVGWLCGTGCLAARFGSNRATVSPAYVAQYLGSKAAQTWLQDNAVGGTMPNLNTSILAALPIRLPSRAEQDEIVAVLEDAQVVIRNVERLIAKQRAIKQGMMQQLLTGKTRVPGFTDPWREVRLGDHASMGSGGTPASGVSDYYGGGIPWVSISDMTRAGRFVSTTEKTLSTEGLARSAAKLYPEGVVLYAMYASLGECAIAVERVSSSQAILGIAPGAGLDRDFLYYCLCAMKDRVRDLGQQGTQSNLNAGMVRDFRLNIPELREQKEITAILSDADDELDLLEKRRAKAKRVKLGMMQELLTGRKRLSVQESVS